MAYTRENREGREKYPCHGAKECTASWTYDDWHCSGCHWKGMGTYDLKYGDDNLRAQAEALRARLATPKRNASGWTRRNHEKRRRDLER